jgi:hypothetical protein
MRFGDWRDRATYLIGEATWAWALLLVLAGLGMFFFGIQIPRAPQWLNNLVIGGLVLAPPAFLAGLKFVDWLVDRRWYTLFETNAVTDTREKWLVPPEVWEDNMQVRGQRLYQVNDGSAYEAREVDYAPEYGDHGKLTVTTTWLPETRDAKLVTSKLHMDEIHEQLQEDHLELTYRRESEDQLASEIQERMVTRFAEAYENGTMLTPDDVADIIEGYKEDMQARIDREGLRDIGPDDVTDRTGDLPPSLPPDQGADVDAELAQPRIERTQPATDGGDRHE